MSNGHVGIFGASGHARVAADCAIASGLIVAAFYDDDEAIHGQTRMGSPGIQIVGGREAAASSASDARLLIAIGENQVRSNISDWFTDRGVEFQTVVHPAAVIGSEVNIGAGTLIVAGVIVNTGASIGNHVIINTSASVDHDCQIGDFVHISPGAHLAGEVKAGEGAHIGMGGHCHPGSHHRCVVSRGSWSGGNA